MNVWSHLSYMYDNISKGTTGNVSVCTYIVIYVIMISLVLFLTMRTFFHVKTEFTGSSM